eukprot:scaffold10764_cov159-Ochromonas_danica.AAC.23
MLDECSLAYQSSKHSWARIASRFNSALNNVPATNVENNAPAHTARASSNLSWTRSSDKPWSSDNSARFREKRKFEGDTVVIPLSHPKLLLKYKVPRIMTNEKQRLVSLQQEYAVDRRMESMPLFYETMAAPVSSQQPNRRESARKFEKDERERRRSSPKRTQSSEDDDDPEDEDLIDSPDLFDDFQPSDFDETERSLSEISSQIILQLDDEGCSLEEMQMMLYTEYGVRVTVKALKRRLLSDRQDKVNRKRTGKTKRDKIKSRNAQLAPGVPLMEVKLPDQPTLSVRLLAELMGISVSDLIKYLMMNEGLMISVNQNVDKNVAVKAIEAFGKKVQSSSSNAALPLSSDPSGVTKAQPSNEGDLVERPPVVAIMGHVDHGKTTLLDRIRNTRVAQSEAGGITQAMSAFTVSLNGNRNITFLDTPGHAAFSEMRKRGAQVTDIVVLVVAADDGVMEQTKECIAAAKQAGCPLVVAINKIDKLGADVEAVKTDLINAGVLLEEFGGDCQMALVSARSGDGVEDLLDKITLQADVMHLRASPNGPMEGTVLEARVDKGLGVVTTGIIRKGSLCAGKYVVAGSSWGKVRLLLDDSGAAISSAYPSAPVQIVGLNSIPSAGETILVVPSEADAKETAALRGQFTKQQTSSTVTASIKANAIRLSSGVGEERKIVKVPFVVKADGSGSVEAIVNYLNGASDTDAAIECSADVVFGGVGEVSTSDVILATATKAKILAFNIAASGPAKDEARARNLEIHYFNVLYDLIDFVQAEIKKIILPPLQGNRLGVALVKKVFKLGKNGKVAGCEITEGSMVKGASVRVLRGQEEVFKGKFASLKVVKEDVDEVEAGKECGVVVEGFDDYQEGDTLECFSSAEK